MPLLKPKLAPKSLRELIEKHDIQFEGPVPPRMWPDQYRNIFQVVRDIWANRYDTYTQRTDIDQETIDKQTKRVRSVVDKAVRFRKNIGSHEGTWRDSIEKSIIGLFEDEVVCKFCGHETWNSDYKAHPLDEREKKEWKEKSENRRPCNGQHPDQPVIWVDDDSDEERGDPIFQSVIGEEVCHASEDNLGDSGIPMRPDRVFGLSRTVKFREHIEACLMNLVHDPMKVNDMVYPFLVLEAKRERNPPGFRAIEAQTAFSIRRFLRIQEDLRIYLQSNLDPLVWFFAYQGDEWRLYAAIINNGRTRVFQLWLGTIESEDGAHQLLQIVDFIWTWARDVYRPQIRRCLAGLPHPYKRSPSFDNAIVCSQSGPPESRVRSFSQPSLDSVQEENATSLSENGLGQEKEIDKQLSLQDASFHPFLRWADRRDLSKSWVFQSSIRHSDIVIFSFCVFEIPETEESLEAFISSLQDDHNAQAAIWHLLALIQNNPCTFVLKRGDLPKMEKSWTGADAHSSHGPNIANSDEAVRVFFFFRSCCRSDWQLKREMYCIVWSSVAAKIFGNRFRANVELDFGDSGSQCVPTSEVIQSFQQLRMLSGKCSVAYALLNVSLILLPFQDPSQDEGQVHWIFPQDEGLPTTMIAQLATLLNSAFSEDVGQMRRHQSNSLLQVFPIQQPANIPPRLLQVGDNFGQLEAVMAIKPSFWPPECPRFCLFVLLDQDFDDESRLRGLLHDTIRVNTFFAVYGHAVQDQPSWSVDDEAILQEWKEFFSEGNMLVC